MPGLTIAAMAAADGHMESNCSSVREGTPGAEHTHVNKGGRVYILVHTLNAHMYTHTHYCANSSQHRINIYI